MIHPIVIANSTAPLAVVTADDLEGALLAEEDDSGLGVAILGIGFDSQRLSLNCQCDTWMRANVATFESAAADQSCCCEWMSLR
jgi:hypothetical protein